MLTTSKNLIVKKNELIAKDTFEMILIGDDFSDIQHGQFINIALEGFFLRRPISICEFSKDQLKIIYKVVGEGTKLLSKIKGYESINCLYPLGNGFELPPKDVKKVTLIGAGIGLPPIYGWYMYLKEKTDLEIKFISGFRSEEYTFYQDRIENPILSLDSKQQNIFDYIADEEYVYVCGPMVVINRLAKEDYVGQALLEERMGCGFGACMGCTKRISETEYKRVCVEGPMFYLSEVKYELEC